MVWYSIWYSRNQYVHGAVAAGRGEGGGGAGGGDEGGGGGWFGIFYRRISIEAGIERRESLGWTSVGWCWTFVQFSRWQSVTKLLKYSNQVRLTAFDSDSFYKYKVMLAKAHSSTGKMNNSRA